MKKILSVIAVSAFVLTAGVALAGGPGKKMDAGCPEACQQQIDDLNSSQAQQNEQLGAHGKTLENHEGRISTLEKDLYDPWYARIGAKAAWMNQEVQGNDIDTDMGWGGALAFGRQFGNFRTELELAFQTSDIDELDIDGDIDATTVMINGYYEMPVADAFAVYAMVGMGFAKYNAEGNIAVDTGEGIITGSFDEDDNAFAYKAGLGVTYNFADNMAADLGYEYLGIADTFFDDINSHNIVASFRYKF